MMESLSVKLKTSTFRIYVLRKMSLLKIEVKRCSLDVEVWLIRTPFMNATLPKVEQVCPL